MPTSPPGKLAPVVEDGETKIRDTDAKTITTPQSQPSLKKIILSPNENASMKTPSTIGSARPPREEMHPSKAQKSTTKKLDSGLILGFQPVKRDSSGNVIKETLASNTPSKVLSSPPSNLGTPSKFGFKFSSDDAQLSEEARKLMESVREDVARIKAQMILERGEQQRKAEVGEQALKGRKIAKPKGKAGRYSDAHMSEFKKMDSIAGHPSAFRAQPGRFTPVTKSLKRKSSKALLDEPEARPSPSKAPNFGTKRVKRTENQINTTARQPENIATPRKVAIPHPSRSTFRSSSLMTPTKSSATRFASARPMKTSMIPSLADSSVARQALPQTPKTEFNPRLKKSLPSLGNLKSILRRRQPLFSADPAKIAAGTHITAPNFNPDINLKDLPTANFSGVELTPSPKKRVEFTSSTKSRRDSILAIPKAIDFAPETTAASSTDIVYPVLPETMTPDKEIIDTPTIRRVRESITAAPSSPLSTIPAIPHGIPNKERKHDSEKGQALKFSSPARKSTFSAVTTASPFPKMPTAPHGISNEKRSREEHSKKQETKPTPVLKATSSPLKAKSPSASLLAVPHGIKNKKRQRADMSDDEDTENIPPAANSVDERNAKRLKASPVKLNPVSPSPIKNRPIITPGRMTGNKSRVGTPGTASKKGVLSLSRLNLLSKPKSRP